MHRIVEKLRELNLIVNVIYIVDRYREILVSMMDSVLNKIQLRHNINELREIDDDTVDDDVSSGHQSFRTWFRT